MNDPSDVHTLSGAYAARALCPAEREAFERHLARCESCRLEVSGFTATVARLGCALAADPPAGMEGRALAAVRTIRQLPSRGRPTDLPAGGAVQRPTDGPGRRVGRLALAACLALTAVLGGIAVDQHDRPRRAATESARLHTELAEFGALLAAPDVRTSTAPTADGTGSGTAVWSRTGDRAAFLAAGRPARPAAPPPRGAPPPEPRGAAAPADRAIRP
ncbi:zf-HC2 domain-containing protein [Kitasatospora sp. NPDC059571]|uniref:anti-sigma factor n=1 Tax=Kitasatospora sp. NPDC059571 TaxID=3346871 RepID=UPI0036C30970